MIKFLKKYKYVSLVAAALMIAVVSGVSGAYLHKVKSSKEFNVQEELRWGIGDQGPMYPFFHIENLESKFTR